MISCISIFVILILDAILTISHGVPPNAVSLRLPPKDPLGDTSPNYFAEAHSHQELDGTTTQKIRHDYFKRTFCYGAEPTVLPQHRFKFAQVRVKEYYNAGLNHRFFKNYTCLKNHEPAEIYCLDRYDGELGCRDYPALSAARDGIALLNRLCYDRARDETTGEAPHMHQSGYDASLTLNTQMRRLETADAYLPPSMVEVDAVCAPL